MRKKVIAVALSLLMAVQAPVMAGELVAEDAATAVEEDSAPEGNTAEAVIIDGETPEEGFPEEILPEEAISDEVISAEVTGADILEEPVEDSFIPEEIFEEETLSESIEPAAEEDAEQLSTDSENITEDILELTGDSENGGTPELVGDENTYNGLIYTVKDDGYVRIDGVVYDDHYSDDGSLDFRDRCWLTEISIPSEINGSVVNEIGDSAFLNCPNLRSVSMPDTIERIGRFCFENCMNLQKVSFSNKLNSMGKGAFCSCEKLDNIVIPKSLKQVEYDYYLSTKSVFSGCTSLEHITFEEGSTAISCCICADCPSLKEIVVPDGVTVINERAFADCPKLSSISLPDSVTRIAEYAFSGNPMLKTIKLPTNLTSIARGAFANCTSLNNIRIPQNLSSVEYEYYSGIHNVFGGCDNLTDISFEQGLTQIPDYLLAQCKALESITMPDSITKIGKGVFEGCELLRNIDFSDNITYIGRYAFNGCNSIEEIRLPLTLQTIGCSAFENCANLSSVWLPKSLNSFDHDYYIGSHSIFSGCTSLSKIEFEENTTEIMDHLFNGCKVIKEVVIPDTVTTIKDAAFYGCSNVKYVIMPKSVTAILREAFEECDGITDVYYAGSQTEWKAISMGNYNDSLLNATIHYNSTGPGDKRSFDIVNDTWNFENPDTFIDVEIFKMFFDHSRAKKLLRDFNYGRNGHCAGMVTSAGASWLGFPDITSYGDYQCLNDIQRNYTSSQTNCKAINFIDYAFAYHQTDEWQDEIYNNCILEGEYGVYLATKNFQENGKDPVYISIRGINNDKEVVGHALLGIRIEEETKDKVKILVYDCNHENERRYLILYKQGDKFDGWYYDETFNSGKIDDGISYCTKIDDFIRDFNTTHAKKSSKIHLSVDYFLEYICYDIASDFESTLEALQHITRIWTATGMQQENIGYLVDENVSELSFSDISGSGDISYAKDDLIVTVTPTEGTNLKLDFDDEAVYIQNEKGSNVDLSYEVSSDYEHSVVTKIEGVLEDNVITDRGENGEITFSGLGECSIELSRNLETSSGTINTVEDTMFLDNLSSDKNYQITQQAEEIGLEIVVNVDNDEDGFYETPVTARKLFKDVTDPTAFFYDPIYWAVDNGITTGYKDNTFRPYNNCNRAAVVTFLWRLAGKPDMGITNAFKDMTGNDDFDRAITWAASKRIATGYNDGTFRPWETCHRAAIVTFLWRFAGRPEPNAMASFPDMTGNDAFNKAISWAAEKGITTGYNDGTFRPWNQCSRLAVVSFLYRYANL